MKNIHQVNKILLILLIDLILALSITHNGSTASLNVQWDPSEISETISPGDAMVKPAAFIISGSVKQIRFVKLRVTKALRPFVSVSPNKIKKPVSNHENPVKINISVPSDTLPGVYDGYIIIKAIRENGKRREIPQYLKVILTVEEKTGDLSVQHVNRYPTRLTQGPENKIYVSDSNVGSIFIYDASLNLVGELKGLNSPLGVAVDNGGNIYVGNDGSDNVEVYSPSGVKLFAIGDGNILMPNDLALDQAGNLYVVDSLHNTVKVYDSTTGMWIRDIGSGGDNQGEMDFPVSLAVSYRTVDGELYVADQGHAKVQVFDLQGNFLRAYGERVASFSSDWQGKFVKLQSLALDDYGRLNAADNYLNKIQILDADTGNYLDSYGEFGTDVGKLNLPLDILITQSGQVAVANAGNHRVEIIIYTIP